jgi:hypothetical protein
MSTVIYRRRSWTVWDCDLPLQPPPPPKKNLRQKCTIIVDEKNVISYRNSLTSFVKNEIKRVKMYKTNTMTHLEGRRTVSLQKNIRITSRYLPPMLTYLRTHYTSKTSLARIRRGRWNLPKQCSFNSYNNGPFLWTFIGDQALKRVRCWGLILNYSH